MKRQYATLLTGMVSDLVPYYQDTHNGVPICIIEAIAKSIDLDDESNSLVKVYRYADKFDEPFVEFTFTDGSTITFGDGND